jgi:iron complex outermembrane receptor protein
MIPVRRQGPRRQSPPSNPSREEGGTAVYGSYSRSFDAVFGSRRDGSALDAETGTQWEGGLKSDLGRMDLSLTVAAFHIVEDNVTIPDPANELFYLQVGQQRSRGVEAELTGQMSRKWSLQANAARLDTAVTRDLRTDLVGNRFRGVPLHSASLWSRYNWVQGPRKTIGAAVGLVHVGDRAGDIENTFTLPDYTRWDLGLFYEKDRLSASFYAENVLDTRYEAGSISALQVYPGAPSSVRGSLRWTF